MDSVGRSSSNPNAPSDYYIIQGTCSLATPEHRSLSPWNYIHTFKNAADANEFLKRQIFALDHNLLNLWEQIAARYPENRKLNANIGRMGPTSLEGIRQENGDIILQGSWMIDGEKYAVSAIRASIPCGNIAKMEDGTLLYDPAA